MAPIRHLAPEILDIIIENLVIDIGIQKAVLLRTVSKAFDNAILYAICTRQVVDVDDPATEYLLYRIDKRLKGKILYQKSRNVPSPTPRYLQAIAQANNELDLLLGVTDLEETRARHEAVAGAVVGLYNGNVMTEEDKLRNLSKGAAIIFSGEDTLTEELKLQYLLSGTAIVGDLPALKSLLTSDGTSPISEIVNGTNSYFHTPLTLAAARGHYGMVDYLLKQGARPGIESIFWKWDKDFIELKDCKGDRFRYLKDVRPSALRAAVSGGHSDLVRLLLRQEYRMPLRSPEYLRAILAATRAGHWNFVELLFETIGKQMSDSQNFVKHMMWEAIRGDQLEILEKILDQGADVDSCLADGGQPRRVALHLAASLGKMRIMKLLLDRGAKPNFGPIALEYIALPIDGAAQSGQKDAMDLLLQHGADPVRAFHAAAWGGQAWLMEDLLARFPELSQPLVLHNCFPRALTSCNLNAMTILVKAGLRLNEDYEADGIHRKAPIYRAMERYGPGPSWVIDHLISLGADVTGLGPIPERYKGQFDSSARGIHISEATWDWVGRY
jgi:ankyrin repeat protein